MINMNISTFIYLIQTVLSPVSVLVTVKYGLIAGILILTIIGFLEFIDIVYKNVNNQTHLH